ncbi:MAG: coproporphyrinogen-III oxidase family protein [bacterium]
MELIKRYKSHHDSTILLKDKFISKSVKSEYLQNLLNSTPKKQAVIYIHVPFCSKICSYCNLNTELINNSLSDYHNLIINQIKKIANYKYIKENHFKSVYFGGGTPTTLSVKQLEEVLDAIKSYLPLGRNTEISFESSLSELTEDKLTVMKDKGVNRFSLGAQTFVDRGRKILGRRGTGEMVIRKIKDILDMGFDNINIDLIYDYPGQNMKELISDLQVIKKLNLAGLSFYSLILHPNSRIYKKIEKDVYKLPNFFLEKKFFYKIYNELSEAGYKIFELTKMVKDKRDKYKYITIKHSNGDVLALGQGAGGRLGNYIYYNGNINMLKDSNPAVSLMGKIVKEEYNIIYKILGEIQCGELKLNIFDKYLSQETEGFKIIVDFFRELKENNFAAKKGSKLKLTKEGVFWGNNISRELTKILIKYFQTNEREDENDENSSNLF